MISEARKAANWQMRVKAAANCRAGYWIPLSDLDMRECDKCKVMTPMEDFGKDTAIRRKSICKPCNRAAQLAKLSEAGKRQYVRTQAKNNMTDSKPGGDGLLALCPACEEEGIHSPIPSRPQICPCGWMAVKRAVEGAVNVKD